MIKKILKADDYSAVKDSCLFSSPSSLIGNRAWPLSLIKEFSISSPKDYSGTKDAPLGLLLGILNLKECHS